MTDLETKLNAVMTNPFVLIVAFVLTLIGAGSGLRSLFAFLTAKGRTFSNSLIDRLIHPAVSDAVNFAANSNDDIISIIGRYNTLISVQILHAIQILIFTTALVVCVITFDKNSMLSIFLEVNSAIWIINHTLRATTTSIQIRVLSDAIAEVRAHKAAKSE